MGNDSWEESVATFPVAPLNLMYLFGRLCFCVPVSIFMYLLNCTCKPSQTVAHLQLGELDLIKVEEQWLSL